MNGAEDILNRLLEAPVGDYGLIGDFTKGKSFRHKVDRALVSHPAAIKKVKSKLAANLDTVFDLYFVNQTNLTRSKYDRESGQPTSRDWTETGKVDPSVLWRDPPEGLGLNPEQVKTDVDNITVVFVGNSAVPHEPMTPWIIAHRIGHAIRREYQYQEMTKYIGKTLKEIAGTAIRQQTFGGYERSSPRQDLTMRLLCQQLGTFKSARDKQLRDQYEFIHEIFALYLMTGKVTLNRIGRKIHTGYTYGKPSYHYRNDQPEEDINDEIADFEAQLNYWCENVVGSIIGDVYVM